MPKVTRWQVQVIRRMVNPSTITRSTGVWDGTVEMLK